MLVKEACFRAFDDNIVALKCAVLIRRLNGNPENDYCIAYGFIDDECGCSFYVFGTAQMKPFRFCPAACPVIVRYASVRDDPVLFRFPCDRKTLIRLYRTADRYFSAAKKRGTEKRWREFGWLDSYRVEGKPDLVRLPPGRDNRSMIVRIDGCRGETMTGKIMHIDGEGMKNKDGMHVILARRNGKLCISEKKE